MTTRQEIKAVLKLEGDYGYNGKVALGSLTRREDGRWELERVYCEDKTGKVRWTEPDDLMRE